MLTPELLPRILDDSRRKDVPTGHVTVTCPHTATDAELRAAAEVPHGLISNVTRHDLDGTATVSIWND